MFGTTQGLSSVIFFNMELLLGVLKAGLCVGVAKWARLGRKLGENLIRGEYMRLFLRIGVFWSLTFGFMFCGVLGTDWSVRVEVLCMRGVFCKLDEFERMPEDPWRRFGVPGTCCPGDWSKSDISLIIQTAVKLNSWFFYQINHWK